MATVVRRKAAGLRVEDSAVGSTEFDLARERRIKAGIARRSVKKELVAVQSLHTDSVARPSSRGGGLARPGSSGLAASGSEALLGFRSKQGSEGAAANGKAPRRRWTVDLSCEQDDEVPSPRWARPIVRKAANRLVIDDEKGYDGNSGQVGEVQEFADMSRKVHGLVQQATLRVLNFFTKIREEHRQQSAKMQESANLQRLGEVSYLIAVTNYKLGKWLFQLSPATYMKPNKPELDSEEHKTPDELFREIQFTLSRTEVLASDLVPKLQKIQSDAKAVATNPRYAKLDNDEPISPGSSNPIRLAQKRGIKDVKELHGVGLHLERLLEVSQSLAHRPAGASAVNVTTTVILAAARFKRCLAKRRARKEAGSADRIAKLLQG